MAERSADESVFFDLLLGPIAESQILKLFSRQSVFYRRLVLSVFTNCFVLFAIELHFKMNDFQVLHRCKLN